MRTESAIPSSSASARPLVSGIARRWSVLTHDVGLMKSLSGTAHDTVVRRTEMSGGSAKNQRGDTVDAVRSKMPNRCVIPHPGHPPGVPHHTQVSAECARLRVE